MDCATRARPDALVGIISPQRRDIEVKLSFTADILPVQQAAIFSKVSGYIRKLHVDRDGSADERRPRRTREHDSRRDERDGDERAGRYRDLGRGRHG